MRAFLSALVVFFATSLVVVDDADARRFGGGKSLGRQYSTMPRSAPRQAPSASQGVSPRPVTGGAGRWLGPLAGLAAGGLLASLLFGDAFQGLQIMDFLVIAALIFGGIALFRALRRGVPMPAGAPAYRGAGSMGSSASGSGFSSAEGVAAPGAGDVDEAPAWLDRNAFADGAKAHFIRLQAAWDRGDFADVREYVTPQLLAELQQERQRLGAGPQHTEVVTLDAELVAVRRGGDQVVASVLFSGLIREDTDGVANRFREIWHVQHAWDTAAGDWYIAGIQQVTD